MNNNIDENMREIIEGWGFPDIIELKNKNLKYVFDDKEVNSDKLLYKGLHCGATSSKFCVYDIDEEEVVFVMDFFICNGLGFISDFEQYIKLMIMSIIGSKYRKKGISTYYLEKLRDYAIKENIKVIKVYPNPNDKIFKGQSKLDRLEKGELKTFYINKSVPKLKFEILQ